MPDAKLRTVRRAVEALGSHKALAEALGVRQQDVADWLAGREAPTEKAYRAALDIAASATDKVLRKSSLRRR